MSSEFECTIGAFQGDSLSGCLFTLVLAGGLYHLRATSSTMRPNPPINLYNLPMEWEYAVDTDFIDEDLTTLQHLLQLCKKVLGEWNLIINEEKTEFVQFYLANDGECDSNGETLKDREEWRTSVSLGSRLCSKVDILHRCNLGNAAFQNYKKVWLKGHHINLMTKLKIYEAQVTSVILYNCNSWAAPQKTLNKLDVCQRRHLRHILKMQWPKPTLTNEALYKKCKLQPLSERVQLSRWKMLGHVLRGDNTTPAQLALHFAVDANTRLPGRIGRHQDNLLRTIRKDLSVRGIKLQNIDDLHTIRTIASNRITWNMMAKVKTVHC